MRLSFSGAPEVAAAFPVELIEVVPTTRLTMKAPGKAPGSEDAAPPTESSAPPTPTDPGPEGAPPNRVA